jgi:preprotein translocase subunit YajC
MLNFFLSLFLILSCAPSALADFPQGFGRNLPPPPPGFGPRPGFGHGPGMPPPPPGFPPPGMGGFGGDHCRPGETAWTDSGMQVRINAVFPNGQVNVVYNSVNFTFDRSQLAVRGCSAGICSGESAVTTSGMNVVVNGVFPNGDFSVVYNSVNFRFSRNDLAPTEQGFPAPPTDPSLRLGDTVYTRSGMTAILSAVFANGQVNVVYNTVNFQMARADIATRGCIGNLCSGDSVVTRSGMNAIVNGFFNDGRTVSVVYNTVNFTFDYNDLAKTWR